ncbi:MAG: DUF3127 domain-containing protein [Balneolaceae bacterium]
MDLAISGKVVKVLEEQTGESKNGTWRKRDFILETGGQYPKQVCITQWGDQIDQDAVKEGDQLTANIDIQSREYNGRWYTDVKAWRIEKGESGAGSSLPHEEETFDPGNIPGNLDDTDDELPF